MDSLKVKIYPPKHYLLKRLIKYYWVLKSDRAVVLNHKLLPVNNIDIVLNFSSPIKFSSGDEVVKVPDYSLSGIRNRHYVNHQAGKLNILGISFYPAGLYPLLKMPLSEFTNETVDLDAVFRGFSSTVGEKICSADSISGQIELLEDYFLQTIARDNILSDKTYRVINAFYDNIERQDVRTFCDRYGINQRRLERIFKIHIGISPKFFKRLYRFQGVLNQILHGKYIDLTSLAHEHDYYDQAHFIKEFRSFTGCSPSRFVKEKKSLKDILVY